MLSLPWLPFKKTKKMQKWGVLEMTEILSMIPMTPE